MDMKKNSVELLLVISVVALTIIGLIMIYSSSNVWALYKFNDSFKYLKNQGLFFILSLFLMYLVSKIDYYNYLKNSNKIFFVILILLILVIIPGIGTMRNGSRSWFGIGSFGIQPSEFAKLGLIIFSSKYLSKNRKSFIPVLVIAIIFFGLIMLQPDFGTGIVLMMIIVALLFVSGVDVNFFVRIGFLGLIGITGLILVAPYRLQRISSFINPWNDPLGSGFQIIQSLYAIGPGGLFGFGLGNSRQKHFYLPEPQTDFIFSIICEELGFFGVLLVVFLFILIISTGFKIASKCEDLFGKFLAFGITFWIAFQTVLNLMVVVGLIPVTGVTLPFLSYGGSSLLILYIAIGIVLNISRYQR
ncbi:MAG: putative lipid II flippase FtsW [Bacilli bacterium]|nr:putative lipid II flippase FtsW [Bacilli bacterium]MDD4733552.1 putative lipid II flippase FtsW [Bacilli bacterium]